MRKHRLQNGREVKVLSFRISGTYAGVLEGTRETVSRHMLKGLREHHEGTVFVAPDRRPFPDWKCEADLRSETGARSDDGGCRSYLSATWFMEDPSLSIDAMVEAVLAHLNWEQNAEDIDIEDFWG